MAYRVDTDFKKDLQNFGLKDWNECYQCGSCTAVCSLTREDQLFPRRSIRLIQMGLKKKITSSVDPWLCYYCGDCSETCPRNANPGEVMMVMRRYLTSLYDWTGLSRKFYISKIWEVAAIIFFALVVIALFVFLAPPPDPTLTAQGGVKINSFAPIKWVELGDWIMAGLIGGLLISNILRMYYKVMVSDKTVRVPAYLYIKEFYNLVFHFASQRKF